MIPTSATLKSSVALRVQLLARKVHRLGERPFFELMCELAGGADPLPRLEAYAALDVDVVRALGGADLAPTIRSVK